jgi:crossover junction endodeoxyribonuclease RusA
MVLHFVAIGVPQQQGSMRAFVPRGHRHAIVTDSNRDLKSWRQLVAQAAQAAILALPATDRGVLEGGVRLTVAFYLPRPKSLAARETAHTKKPDLDKFVRGVQDALSAIAFRDDAQVVDLVAMKRYAATGSPAHAEIWIEPAAGVAALARNQRVFASRQRTLFEGASS